MTPCLDEMRGILKPRRRRVPGRRMVGAVASVAALSTAAVVTLGVAPRRAPPVAKVLQSVNVTLSPTGALTAAQRRNVNEDINGKFPSTKAGIDPGKLLDLAGGTMKTVSHIFHTSFAFDIAGKLANESNTFVFHWHGLESWNDWKEEHTVHAVNAP